MNARGAALLSSKDRPEHTAKECPGLAIYGQDIPAWFKYDSKEWAENLRPFSYPSEAYNHSRTHSVSPTVVANCAYLVRLQNAKDKTVKAVEKGESPLPRFTRLWDILMNSRGSADVLLCLRLVFDL